MTNKCNRRRVNKTNDVKFDLLSKDLNKYESCYQTLSLFLLRDKTSTDNIKQKMPKRKYLQRKRGSF